jgi:beta-lactamase regulating signal transducer with metallopeptidase domain
VSILLALVLAGLGLWMPEGAWNADLAAVVHVCEETIRGGITRPADALVHLLGIVTAVAVTARAGVVLVAELRRARREARRHGELLRLAGTPHPRLGATVLDHPVAAAYCLPAPAGDVVVTSAALRLLDPEELAAVLAHERTHLRERHDLVVAVARAVERTLPWLPAARTARGEQERLVELIADDAAARRSERHVVARAVVRLAEGTTPPAALGAGDVAAAQRVERLLDDPRPLSLAARLLVILAATLVAAAPVLIAAAPALTAMHATYCLIGEMTT